MQIILKDAGIFIIFVLGMFWVAKKVWTIWLNSGEQSHYSPANGREDGEV